MSIKSILENQDGVAATEFALIAPVFIVLIVGVLDFGMYMNNSMKLENMARSAAEYVRQGGDPDDIATNIITASNSGLTDAELNSIDLSSSYACECTGGTAVDCSSGSCASGDYVRRFLEIDMDMEYTSLLPYTGRSRTISLSGSSRIQAN